jgi:hypothetical protein
MSPQELDAQSSTKVERWIDVHSQECRDMDDTREFTLKCLKIGFEDGYMFTDSLGRIWCKGQDGRMHPFHFEYGKKLIGYRLPKTAAN